MITGYIYAICHDREIIYTGKTVNMRKRWANYRDHHNNPNHGDYDMNISAFMRAKGFDNCEMVLLETIEVENGLDLFAYEGMWQETFENIGCNLQNKYKAGNGSSKVKGTIGYDNGLARSREKIPCPLCGFVGGRGDIRRHQRSFNCVAKS
tara:strand:- start:24 stop:476 length:453 start_codon:yes stop_codon:yes gene_type:complete